jgi:hypothetical protein
MAVTVTFFELEVVLPPLPVVEDPDDAVEARGDVLAKSDQVVLAGGDRPVALQLDLDVAGFDSDRGLLTFLTVVRGQLAGR